jgi:hypothetical protein
MSHDTWQVQTKEHKAAHGGKSRKQVLRVEHKAANGGMSRFQLDDEKFRAAHKGHSEVQVKKITAQVAEQANSVNAQMEGTKQLTDDDSDFAKALSMLEAKDGNGDVVEGIVKMASRVFNQERASLLQRKKEGYSAYVNKACLMCATDWWCEVRKNGHVTGNKVFSPMCAETDADGTTPTYTFTSDYASRYVMTHHAFCVFERNI